MPEGMRKGASLKAFSGVKAIVLKERVVAESHQQGMNKRISLKNVWKGTRRKKREYFGKNK